MSSTGQTGETLRNVYAHAAEPVTVAEGYQRWAATYDSSPNPLLAREQRYVLPLLPDLAGKQVLDIGCGTGRWLQMLMERGAGSAVGVDVSSAMLSVASNKGLIRQRVLQADCLELPFQSSVFDFVICSFAMSHMKEVRNMLRELGRVTKGKSELWVTDLHPEAYARGWRTGFRDAQGAAEIEGFPRSAETLIRVFHSAGFECLSHVSLCLGEAERTMFRQAAKLHLFEAACRVPAILVWRFRRLSSQPRVGDNL